MNTDFTGQLSYLIVLEDIHVMWNNIFDCYYDSKNVQHIIKSLKL